MSFDYSKSVLLPKTDFPMKADLPRREPARVADWKAQDIYRRMLENRAGRKKFVLHDGPPYANGRLHMGHALNKILKDMIVKWKNLAGFEAPYVPGWDCHGLPIEHQLMKDLKTDKHSVDVLTFRKQAAEFAMKFVGIQREEFERLGILGDWQNPYLTLAPHYEEAILRVFRELLLGGFIYRSLKPVQWCAHCETALADAEVEYEDKTSTAVTVKFPAEVRGVEGPASILIWTTTPWTLPANVGVMVHPKLAYAVVKMTTTGERWILAQALVEKILQGKLQMNSSDYTVESSLLGEELEARVEKIARPFDVVEAGLKLKVMLDESVSSEDGTGVVHIAPGHGEVDYEVGHLRNQQPILSPVGSGGKFSAEVKALGLEGLFVLSHGNAKVLELLKEKALLLHEEKIQHSYPRCWRCRNPIIFRATHQWFLNVEHKNLRGQLAQVIDSQVQWVPAYGKNRIGGMVAGRPDWCLSRQRIWGVPLPIFYCKACNEPLTDDQAVGMVEELVGIEGSDVWFKEDADYFLKNLQPFKCHKCGGQSFERGHDILDVWFDSGSSFEAVLNGRGKTLLGHEWKQDLGGAPADLYLEGSDQHRGWFQSSLIPSVALTQKAPYRAVLTHGFIVDGQGRKMSKSMGNVIAPEEILRDYGADILRLWVAASDYREDIRLSKDILKGVAENYRKLRNTLRYILGSLSDFDPAADVVPKEKMLEIDRWILSRLAETLTRSRESFEAYEFHRVAVALTEFCGVDCSSFYFDILKDRLYTWGQNSLGRRSAQTALYHIFTGLLPAMSPILTFTAEEAWQLGRTLKFFSPDSVLLADWPEKLESFKDSGLEEKWEKILKLKVPANLALESERQAGRIGSSLAAKLIFSEEKFGEMLSPVKNLLPGIFLVSQVELGRVAQESGIQVAAADGKKCARCWRFETTLGQSVEHPEICERCLDAISGLQNLTLR